MLGKKLVALIVCLQIITCTAFANKSVFIISNHSSSRSQAYSIGVNGVDYQADVDISTLNPGYGAVGNVVWQEKNLIFVTYESSGMIVWASTKTLEKVNEYDTEKGSLAGIVVDEAKDLIYVIGRQSSNLYVYSYDDTLNTLFEQGQFYLNHSRAQEYFYISGMGLALDETKNLLYVTSSNDSRVHLYDTNDLVGESGNVDPNDYIDIVIGGTPRNAVGIAVDPVKRYMYTGDIWGHNYLVRTNIDTNTSIEVEVTGDWYSGNATGLGVDDETGLVFCTTSLNDFRVYDSNLVLKDTEANNISGPAGVAVGGWYKTPSFSLVKDNNDVNNGCVDPNSHKNLKFDIFWDVNSHPDTNMKVIDYLPAELDYNSSSPAGDYNDSNRTVTWNISGSSGHIVLNTNVNNWTRPCGIITNIAVMEGDTYLTRTDCNVDVCPWGSQIIYVDKDANGFNNGTSWNDAYNDLQDALAQAENCLGASTSIWVAAGTYKPVNDVNVQNYQQKSFELLDNVALIGHFGGIGTWETSPNQRNFADANKETILEGKIGQDYWEAVSNVVKGQSIDSALIDGFTIKGSYGYSGVYLVGDADVSIANCKIRNNQSYGIYSDSYSYPDVYNCTFTDNSSEGMRITNHCWPEISSCVFDGNAQTYYGIYMEYYSVVSVDDTLFKRHTGYDLYGGNGDLTLTNSTLDSAGYGGIYLSNLDLAMDHCIVSRSGVQLLSGCNLSLQNSIIRYSSNNGIELSDNLVTTIKNNWIHNNGASGISFTNQSSVPLVRNNTIYDNQTYGIWSSQQGADPNVINCIISGNDTNDLYRINGSFNKVNYCLLQNPHSGTGNKTGSPGFFNPSEPNDLHIADTSQCKNAGDPNGDYSDEDDIDGDPRIAEGRADIGGDEYYWSKADYNKDEIVNFKDFAIFAGPWHDQNEAITLDDDNDVDIYDLALFCEDWLWQPVWVTEPWFDMSFGESGGFSETAFEFVGEDEAIRVQTSDSLMLPDVKASMSARPARLKARTDKFYEIAPKENRPSLKDKKATRANALELLKLLEYDWNSGNLKEIMDEDTYLELREYAEKMASE